MFGRSLAILIQRVSSVSATPQECNNCVLKSCTNTRVSLKALLYYSSNVFQTVKHLEKFWTTIHNYLQQVIPYHLTFVLCGVTTNTSDSLFHWPMDSWAMSWRQVSNIAGWVPRGTNGVLPEGCGNWGMLCVQPREMCPLTYYDNNYCKYISSVVEGQPFFVSRLLS